MCTLHEPVLDIGSIILGSWGVRSVVVQTPLPDVMLIDLILGFVILHPGVAAEAVHAGGKVFLCPDSVA